MTKEELSKLYSDTAAVYAALAVDPATPHQASDDGKEWSAPYPFNWRYRRLLPPPKTEEQQRVERNLALKVRLKDPKLAQWRCLRDGYPNWMDQTEWGCVDDPGCEFREKPAPQIVPWSYADQLCGMVVKHKEFEIRGLIITQKPETLFMLTGERVSYSDLLKCWKRVVTLPDGSIEYAPCGKEVA